MKKRYQVLLVLSILSMITFLDRIALSSASGSIMDELHISTVQWGWILGMFTLAYGAFEIPAGWLGDRIGGKKVLTRVVLWWSVFTILTGLASGFVMLLVIRIFFGMGEAGAYPNTAIVLSKWFPVEERGRAQSLIWAASRIGAALTPLIVLPLQKKINWQFSFYVLGAAGIAWAIYWVLWHREEPRDSPSISPEELSFIEDNRALAEHSSKIKTSFTSGLRSPHLWLLMALYFCYAIGAYFFQSWYHTYLEKGRLMAKEDLLWASSLPYILAAIGCLAGGWLSDQACLKWGKKWGRRIVPVLGLFIAGISVISASLLQDNRTAILAMSIGMACMDVTAPVAWAIAMDIGGEKSGTVSGVMNTAGLTGAYLSTISFGYLAASWGYSLPVTLIGIIVLLGALLALKIDATKKIEFKPIERAA